ncbi:GFA family protein [Ramlibacter cellulosilyticus]
MLSGSCACGAVRYACAGEPVAMLNCHCGDCQRASGAPFASGVVVRTADLAISGTPKAYAVRASSGRMTTRGFCGDCGTPLFTQGEANAQFTSIRFPTLDDASGFAPMLDIWTSRAQPWVCLDEKIPHFPESPQPPA